MYLFRIKVRVKAAVPQNDTTIRFPKHFIGLLMTLLSGWKTLASGIIRLTYILLQYNEIFAFTPYEEHGL